MDCRNHRLALCLVHLLKTYRELESFYFRYERYLGTVLVKQAVFENAQMVDDLKPLKILEACTTGWLTYGETSARVINQFKQVIATIAT